MLKEQKASLIGMNFFLSANSMEPIGMLMGGCLACDGHQVGMWAALGGGCGPSCSNFDPKLPPTPLLPEGVEGFRFSFGPSLLMCACRSWTALRRLPGVVSGKTAHHSEE